MREKAWLSFAGLGLELGGAGAQMLWPDQHFIAWTLIFLGAISLASAAYLALLDWGVPLPSVENVPLLGSFLVPIDVAARLAFEAAEKAGVADLTTHPDTAPDERLRHFIYTFMVDDETTLLGAKPPSTSLRPIPHGETLYPVIGQNRLDALTPRRVAFENVKIRRSDLNRIIREYPRQARQFGRKHGINR